MNVTTNMTQYGTYSSTILWGHLLKLLSFPIKSLKMGTFLRRYKWLLLQTFKLEKKLFGANNFLIDAEMGYLLANYRFQRDL